MIEINQKNKTNIARGLRKIVACVSLLYLFAAVSIQGETLWQAGPGDADKMLGRDVSFNLQKVPPYGALFTFKAVNATTMVPEVAVFANGLPCGILQIAGARYPGFGPPIATNRVFNRPCYLYIPKEFLVAGTNTLRIQRLGHPYNRKLMLFLGFTTESMRLDALSASPTEPLHTKPTFMGVAKGSFPITEGTIGAESAADKWLGIAYSGNPQRVTFWNDIRHLQPKRMEYLLALRDLNMRVILDGWNCARTKATDVDPDGKPPAKARAYLDEMFTRYGNLIQFYEINNEPCMGITDAAFAYVLAVTKYVNSIKPSHLLIAPPGWAFGGGYGDPKNWDDGKHDDWRRQIDDLCQTLNGHSYGNSYAYDNGSLAENCDTYGSILTNGWQKPFINTECGAGDMHKDIHELGGNQQASIFDRNLRAHISWADYFTVFSLWEDKPFTFLTGDENKPETWQARPVGQDADTRVKIFRRLALAYSTHGKPLAYTFQNPDEVRYQLVYFRGVDTSTLQPLPGSGATAGKILLNFVNFDLQQSHTLSVRITMPQRGVYKGERFGPGDSYTAARSIVDGLNATPQIDLKVELGPGDAVQYILDPPTKGI
ncbi:MAG TPA: hypothetical protein PLW02_05070 [Verrucomicrobiota bacterium]|nr:hypothetical protein [Verrucomicrobiota bacterium]